MSNRLFSTTAHYGKDPVDHEVSQQACSAGKFESEPFIWNSIDSVSLWNKWMHARPTALMLKLSIWVQDSWIDCNLKDRIWNHTSDQHVSFSGELLKMIREQLVSMDMQKVVRESHMFFTVIEWPWNVRPLEQPHEAKPHTGIYGYRILYLWRVKVPRMATTYLVLVRT